MLTHGITDVKNYACLSKPCAWQQVVRGNKVDVFLASIGYYWLRRNTQGRTSVKCKWRDLIFSISALCVSRGALTGDPEWPRLRRKPRAGAGTVAAGRRMDRDLWALSDPIRRAKVVPLHAV